MIKTMTMTTAPDAAMKIKMTSPVKKALMGSRVDGGAVVPPVLAGGVGTRLVDGDIDDGVDDIVGSDGGKDADIVAPLLSTEVGGGVIDTSPPSPVVDRLVLCGTFIAEDGTTPPPATVDRLVR